MYHIFNCSLFTKNIRIICVLACHSFQLEFFWKSPFFSPARILDFDFDFNFEDEIKINSYSFDLNKCVKPCTFGCGSDKRFFLICISIPWSMVYHSNQLRWKKLDRVISVIGQKSVLSAGLLTADAVTMYETFD